MSIITPSAPACPKTVEYGLHSGDKMTREEFHRLYQRTPEEFKAELIGGTVYVASPLRNPHAIHHVELNGVLFYYKAYTPGVQAGDNATLFLSNESEPQPDLYLRILPEFGGQSRINDDEYVVGAPELVIEVAHSSRSLDLHGKRNDYTVNGVREYLVATLEDRRLRWFDLSADTELAADADGIIRLRQFPGLWIHVESVFTPDSRKLMEVLQQGISSPEHSAFVERLTNARQSR
jgi:Uma2 family endonuclease